MTNKIVVAVPKVLRPLPPKLDQYLGKTKFKVIVTENIEQAVARTRLVTQMLNEGFEALAFIDSDMSPNIDMDKMFEKFYNVELPVISALTSTRGRQHQLLLFKKNPNISYPLQDELLFTEDSIINVYAIGFGACLIRKEVFNKIDLPWFKTGWTYTIPETREIRHVGGNGMGADFWFSMQCLAAKVPLYLDCGSLVHHMEMEPSSSYYKQEFPWEETLIRIRGEVMKNG